MIHQIHTAVLQLSYREIFIFLNIPGKDLTGSLAISFLAVKIDKQIYDISND